MGLTKEHKDGLIQCLYGPMFDYVAAVIEKDMSKEDKRFSRLARYFEAAKSRDDFGLSHNLRIAAIYDYEAKAKFAARVSAIIDAYLEGRVQKEPLPSPEPVSPVSEQDRQKFVAGTLAHLAAFQWENLKSDDYATARRAWWVHDWLAGVCQMNPETREAYEKARAEATID